MNDREREMWVLNDEGLYMRRQNTGLSMRRFLREYREEIDAVIKAALGKEGS